MPPRLPKSLDKGRTPWLSAVLLLAAVLSALAAAVDPSCVSSGSSVALSNMPSQTRCVITYGTKWNMLETLAVKPAANGQAVVLDQSNVVHVEFYSNAKCSVFVDSTDCTVSASTPTTQATTAPTTKATTAPTTKATSAPATSAPTTKATTAPTTKATTAPTTKATTAPTTKATTAPATSAPTTKATTAPATSAPTTKATTAPATSAPTTKATTAPSSGSGSSRAPTNVRAMYVWEYGDCLFNNVAAGTTYSAQCGVSDYLTYQDSLISNLLDPWGQFPMYNRIFLEMDIDNVQNSPAIVRAFLVKAHAAGIKVDFLDGVASWVESTANAQTPMSECDALVAFNQGSTDPAEWIDGLNFDIEPHTLPDWHTVTPGAPDNYNQVYEANLMAIFNHCMTVTRPTEMTVTWSVGNDYYKYVHGLWNPLLGSSPYVDYVTVMNYYGNETEFLDGGSEDGTTDVGGVGNILASLQGGIVTAVFAAETMPPAYAPAWESFWSLGSLALENTLAAAVSEFSSNPLFSGVCTHWFGTYFSLPPNGPAAAPTCSSSGTTVTITTSTDYACIIIYQIVNTKWMALNQDPVTTEGTSSYVASKAGPYAVEFYDAINSSGCTTASAFSTIDSAVCT